ncbi:LytR/AlgR family response regulator transcription factor [Ruminococcus sp.]|uniref:LytR/AlgR family response regulator transcription factor n=1 Tax=Ruminococcus sp. TaxID=41978 RepID=UPI0039954E82
MIRIAIVDDEKEQVVMLSTCVSVFFQEKNLEYRIFPFFCGEDLLSCNIPIDVAFLDIQMNGINGIETAQRLRAWNKWVALIYITSYDSYIQKAMTIHPFAYLTKPTEKVAIFQVLDEYLSFQRSITNAMPKEYFQLSTENSCKYVEMSDIYYFCYVQDHGSGANAKRILYHQRQYHKCIWYYKPRLLSDAESEFFGKHPAYSGD